MTRDKLKVESPDFTSGPRQDHQGLKLKIENLEEGFLSLQVLIFSALAIIILSAFVIWADTNLKTVYRSYDRAQALEIAEAGIEYYRWHLAHAPNDFQDGTGHVGPYTHIYYDKDGKQLGKFILDIIPPDVNSSIVTLKSKGQIDTNPNIERQVETKMALLSVIKYAIIANNNLKIENGTEIFGPVHANGGIHFDGLAHNLVTSGRSTYDDPDHGGSLEYGIHTHVPPVDLLPPSPLPIRSDVFENGRNFPVPIVDFNGLTLGLAQIKSTAQKSGNYLAPSGNRGYHIVLKTNDTFDVYKVTRLIKHPEGCRNILKPRQKGWGIWSIYEENFVANYPFPANGLIYVEDSVWVEGQINTAKITVAAGLLPASLRTYKNIYLNKNLTYTNYDGQDAIGLIAQGNVTVGMVSDDNLRVDAAVVAQNGSVSRYYYRPSDSQYSNCSPYNTRQSLTLNGMIAANTGYGFAYTDGNGYQNRDIIYDANLFYNPPPGFPFISGDYKQISWKITE